MSELPPAMAAAKHVPFYALAFSNEDDAAIAVAPDVPLPVAPVVSAAISTPLTGTASTNATVGPFAPEIGRPIWLTLRGSWTGQVRLLRSTDAGITRHPLTIGGARWAEFTANANEPVTLETCADATYYLEIALSSGTLSYQVSQ